MLLQGDACANCHTAFLRSFVTYDHLPAVLFELAPGVGHDEALRLLAERPPAFQARHKCDQTLPSMLLRTEASAMTRRCACWQCRRLSLRCILRCLAMH